MSDICAILESYSNLILAIMDDEDSDPLWHKFYRIQMANYLLGQKNLEFDLEPIFIVYNLIQQSWDELKEFLHDGKFPVRDFDSICKQINIDFPIDRFTQVSENDSEFCLKNYAESF